MRRICMFLVSAAVLLSTFGVNAAGNEYHFYLKRARDHHSPTTDERYLSLFEDRNAFFLDRTAAQNSEKKIT